MSDPRGKRERHPVIVLTGFLIGLGFIVIGPDYLQFTLFGPTRQPFPRIFPQMVIPSRRNILETHKSNENKLLSKISLL